MAQDLDIREKVTIAASFLLDSPPGEVNDVFNDVRTLIDNDEELQIGIIGALEEYNTEQLITVKLPGDEREVIVSKFGQIDNEHFIDPKSQQIFKAALDEAIQSYVLDHYPNGVSAVYGSQGKLTIAIVDIKYNPENYWGGRWRSVWTIEVGSVALKGSLKVHVHYYEDGNVQLTSNKDAEVNAPSLPSDPKAIAEIYAKVIARAEKEYQTALNESYAELAENTFKGLRRALPLTRNKLDWNKILNYKIASELANK
ncbi:hypothetical protein BC937DRAFT_88244 [Endogone sp. FLAS-F59071]|nr:hypothetical protein BC937DRAFT_88244 [Endogone sp. FLAS-F59071]|eukprot:RUS22607.1 hypothetical protein BC937DRAFT_88244 [Endogone sp. FLAS-F59071]